MSRYDVDWDEMEDLAVVAPFFDELRTQFAEGPAPEIGTELATLFVFGAPPVGVVKPTPAPSTRSRTTRRVAAGAVGGLALIAGMGAAGALPGPIQDPVASAAKFVGLNLPHAHHHHHPTPASGETGGDKEKGSSPEVTTHAHRSSHVPTESDQPTPLKSDGSTGGSTGTTGATTGQSGTTTKRTGTGSSTSTGNSTVTGSGSAVSSTGGSGSGDHGTNGNNQHQRPTYHGNGRTTRNDGSTTSTTAPPSGSGDSGGGSTPTTTPPDTTPTTSAPTS
ncbi:MAG: hypothetical protein JOY57_12325 [Actinobacteria bacterium]|nr:hypothetical protein [Actinomycetota bacterium]